MQISWQRTAILIAAVAAMAALAWKGVIGGGPIGIALTGLITGLMASPVSKKEKEDDPQLPN